MKRIWDDRSDLKRERVCEREKGGLGGRREKERDGL
jgi:hypothetical protein